MFATIRNFFRASPAAAAGAPWTKRGNIRGPQGPSVPATTVTYSKPLTLTLSINGTTPVVFTNVNLPSGYKLNAFACGAIVGNVAIGTPTVSGTTVTATLTATGAMLAVAGTVHLQVAYIP